MDDTPRPSSAPLKWSGFLRLMRPRQWIKNSFVIAPLVFAGQFKDMHAVVQALEAAFLFCVASSAACVNDLKDIDRDRSHPSKSKTRPLATGVVSIIAGSGVAGVALRGAYLELVLPPFGSRCHLCVFGNELSVQLWFEASARDRHFYRGFRFVLRVYAGAQALGCLSRGCS